MKDLQIFHICIWKKVFQINYVNNYFEGTSFLQFHTNQTTNRIIGVFSDLPLVLCIYSRCLYNKDIYFR